MNIHPPINALATALEENTEFFESEYITIGKFNASYIRH